MFRKIMRLFKRLHKEKGATSLEGCHLYFYDKDKYTVPVWLDKEKTIPHPSPIILGEGGKTPIYFKDEKVQSFIIIDPERTPPYNIMAIGTFFE